MRIASNGEKSTPMRALGMIERSGRNTGSVSRARTSFVVASPPDELVVGNQLSTDEAKIIRM
jgi:hypothetical protein